MEFAVYEPVKGARLAEVSDFLKENGIAFDEGAILTVVALDDDGRVVASGSLERNVLKCIAVSPARQSEGLAAAIVGTLVSKAVAAGNRRLFIFTKPANRALFMGLGFYPVAETQHVLLLENERGGVRAFVESLLPSVTGGVQGGVVVNCNPFTNGHLFLLRQASLQCETLHVFVLSEDQSAFTAKDRFALVRAGAACLPNVRVHPTGDYMVSAATFPVYFHKDQSQAVQFNCELDLKIFAECFARPMHITRRFVGEEPYCRVTKRYNEQMKRILPAYGIDVVEFPRYTCGGEAISASKVREYLALRQFDRIRPLVPETTFDFLMRTYGDNRR